MWFALLSIVLAGRFCLIRSMNRQIERVVSSKCSQYVYTLSSSAIGFVWALGAILTLQTEQPDVQVPVVLITSGLAFGGIIYHINFRLAFHAYFWSLMGPVSLYLIFAQQQHLSGGTIIATGAIYLFFYAGKLHLRSIQWIKENVERETLITDLSSANNKIKKLSETDALTGLNNRTFFNQYLAKVWQQATSNEQHLSVVLLDIDYFKPYNDNYGHVAGDEALRQVAQV
ncbi:GGDEF domain-containing protein, partial [Vibrio makurazakiensis]|uniref:GGDEF domain-containing protein n=1 Tax=Vibrio makurazakiensis TaxID=2910250 RepID=UPI003D10416C